MKLDKAVAKIVIPRISEAPMNIEGQHPYFVDTLEDARMSSKD